MLLLQGHHQIVDTYVWYALCMRAHILMCVYRGNVFLPICLNPDLVPIYRIEKQKYTEKKPDSLVSGEETVHLYIHITWFLCNRILCE